MAKKTTKVSLKLLVDKRSNKVLFAEAGKDFVDFLFNILSLPVSTVIRLLKRKGMVGCISNLYKSVDNLNDSYVQPNQTKESIIKPKARLPLLSLNDAPVHSVLYTCRCGYYSDDSTSACPSCGKIMTSQLNYVAPVGHAGEADKAVVDGGSGFVKEVVTNMVMDDLVVSPMSTISSIALLNKFNIRDVGALEERVVNFDMAELHHVDGLTNSRVRNTLKVEENCDEDFIPLIGDSAHTLGVVGYYFRPSLHMNGFAG